MMQETIAMARAMAAARPAAQEDTSLGATSCNGEDASSGCSLWLSPAAYEVRREGAGRRPVSAVLFRTSGVAGLFLIAASLFGQAQPAPQPAPQPVPRPAAPRIVTGAASSSLASYLQRVRVQASAEKPEPGAIWSESGRFTRLMTDVRAMRPHDLVSIVVSESLAASTDGSVKNTRASNMSSQVSSLIGVLHAGNALQNLVNQNSNSGLNAQGASATNSSLTTVFGGQVVEVLPNGMLVIEAAREVEFSQQTQTIILRGLVRPEDISQQNQVLSTAISDLELQVRGKGIVNDSTHRQNLLVRLLQQILVF